MEAFLISIAPELITLLGVALAGLATWGISLLRQRVKAEVAINALDAVDSIVGAVVGNLSQTAAKQMREASEDGHLSKEEKTKLKRFARDESIRLISKEVAKAASNAVVSLDSYLSKRIEEQVLALKR